MTIIIVIITYIIITIIVLRPRKTNASYPIAPALPRETFPSARSFPVKQDGGGAAAAPAAPAVDTSRSPAAPSSKQPASSESPKKSSGKGSNDTLLEVKGRRAATAAASSCANMRTPKAVRS